MSFTRRSLLATLGLTLPVAAAEAATKRTKKTAAKAPAHTTTHASRTSRLRRAAPRAQG